MEFVCVVVLSYDGLQKICAAEGPEKISIPGFAVSNL
jgi:hypothetical protein